MGQLFVDHFNNHPSHYDKVLIKVLAIYVRSIITNLAICFHHLQLFFHVAQIPMVIFLVMYIKKLCQILQIIVIRGCSIILFLQPVVLSTHHNEHFNRQRICREVIQQIVKITTIRCKSNPRLQGIQKMIQSFLRLAFFLHYTKLTKKQLIKVINNNVS